MNKIIVITGPTASGKTNLAIKIAKDFNAEIINADSFQVYKEINAGVNKPSQKQMQEIKHHLINSFSIYDTFDIKVFQDEATKIIKSIQNKNIIICGGSNLYIDSLIKGYNLNKSLSREDIDYFNDWNYDDIYNYVYERDPVEALKINYNNKKRIIRAAQIIHSTNNKKSELDNQKNQYIYDCFIIVTKMERDQLYKKINHRTEKMLMNNWNDEVQELIKKDNNVINLQAFKAIGYKQIADSIINNQAIDLEKIKQITRNLAKKQMTWCKTKYLNNKYEYDITKDDYEILKDKLNKWLTTK